MPNGQSSHGLERNDVEKEGHRAEEMKWGRERKEVEVCKEELNRGGDDKGWEKEMQREVGGSGIKRQGVRRKKGLRSAKIETKRQRGVKSERERQKRNVKRRTAERQNNSKAQ